MLVGAAHGLTPPDHVTPALWRSGVQGQFWECRHDGHRILRTAVPRAAWRRIRLFENASTARPSRREIAALTGYTEASIAVILSRARKRIGAACGAAW